MTIISYPTKLYFDGNAIPGFFQPLDLTALQIGAVTDYSFGAIVNLRKKSTSIQNDDHALMAFDFSYGGDAGGAFYIHATNGSFNVFFGQTNYASTTGLFTYETDQLVVVTITGTTLKVYCQAPGAASSLVWTQTVTRKATGNNSNSYFCMEGFQFRGLYGTIRDIFIVKSLLTSTDVTNISAGTYPTLLGHWKCDEGIGFAIRDTSGNGNTALVIEGSNNSPFPDWRSSSRRVLR